MSELVKVDRVEKILSLFEDAKQNFRKGLEDALEIGGLLCDQKREMVLTGENFRDWLGRFITNEEVSESLCYKYMGLAIEYEKADSKIDPRLGIKENIKLVADVHRQEKLEKEKARQDKIDLWLQSGIRENWDKTTYRRATEQISQVEPVQNEKERFQIADSPREKSQKIGRAHV